MKALCRFFSVLHSSSFFFILRSSFSVLPSFSRFEHTALSFKKTFEWPIDHSFFSNVRPYVRRSLIPSKFLLCAGIQTKNLKMIRLSFFIVLFFFSFIFYFVPILFFYYCGRQYFVLLFFVLFFFDVWLTSTCITLMLSFLVVLF